MNQIYKTIRKSVGGATAVVSELAKGQLQDQSALTTPPSSSSTFFTYPCHLTAYTQQHATGSSPQTLGSLRTSVLMVASAFLLTALGSTAQAGETIVYDDIDAATGLKLQNGPLFFPGPNMLFPGTTVSPGASDNTVTVNYAPTTPGVNNPSFVYGGFAEIAEVRGNTVNILNGLGLDVYGGFSSTGNATGNSVTVSGGTVRSDVTGGFSNTGNVTGNSAMVSGGSVGQNVNGGASNNGEATGNSATVSGGTVDAGVHGGYSIKNATGNSATLSGGSVGQNVFGGFSATGNATGNSVIISGGSVGQNVLGGASNTQEATGNSVTFSGGTVDYDVYGGHSAMGSATGNTVTFSGGTVRGSIYGGESLTSGKDAFTGNTLNVKGAGLSVGGDVKNFQFLNFYLPSTLAADTTVLTVTGTADLTDGAGASSTVNVGIEGGASPLKVGDTITLIDAATLTTESSLNTTANGQGMQGISLLYDFDLIVQNNQLIATVTASDNGNTGGSNGGNSGNAARVNPQLKALSEGYLAGSQLVMRGADLVAADAFNAINLQNNENGWVPFAMMSGQHNRYNSGSHIKSNDFLLTGGLSYQQDNLTAGAFLEAGWGSYDSYNSFYNAANVKGDGNSRYYGLGVLGRYDFTNGLYADASLRFGRNRNKFDSDIQNIATGQFANYTVTSSYVSAHIGAGYMLNLSDKNQLDLSAKYLYSTLGGKDVNVAGDHIRFDRIDSHRARINATLNHQYSEALTLNAGLGYEHEFDGKARATTYGVYNIDAPSVRGGTGIVSVGANIKPTSNQRLTLDIKANGYTGKREGVGASIRVNYAF